MCVCMYMYVCMFVYVCVYIYIYIYIYVYFMCMCMCACMFVHACMCLLTDVHATGVEMFLLAVQCPVLSVLVPHHIPFSRHWRPWGPVVVRQTRPISPRPHTAVTEVSQSDPVLVSPASTTRILFSVSHDLCECV